MTFNDPIVGSVELLRPSIQSPNYVANTTGWSINDDGSADFADLTIHGGAIHLLDGSGNTVEVTLTGMIYTRISDGAFVKISTDASFGPTLKLLPQTSYGGHDIAAAIVGSAMGVGTLAGNPKLEIISPDITGAGNVAIINLYGQSYDGTQLSRIELTAGTIVFSGTVEGNIGMTGNVTKDSWHAATPQNGWTGNIRYRKIACPPDAVQIYVRVTPGTKTDGTLLFDLPATPSGYRLTGASVDLPCAAWAAGSQPPHLAVDSDGHVRIYGLANTGSLNLDAWFTTDNGGI